MCEQVDVVVRETDRGTAELVACVIVLQSSTVMLLQELLSYQDKFGSHYMAGLEGCGLSVEADVRGSYYTLVRRLVSACRSVCRVSASRSLSLQMLNTAVCFCLIIIVS